MHDDDDAASDHGISFGGAMPESDFLHCIGVWGQSLDDNEGCLSLFFLFLFWGSVLCALLQLSQAV